MFKRIYSRDGFFYGFLLMLTIFIGQLPIFLRFLHTPSHFYFPLLDGGAFSDFYYIGLIRFGMENGFLLTIPYVPEQHQASLIQILFVLLGKISFVTRIGPAEILNLSRIGGGVVYGLSVIFLFKEFFSKQAARLAFLLFLFAQPIPLFFRDFINQDFGIWVWNFHEASRRIGIQPPHYTLGRGLAIFGLTFLIQGIRRQNIRYILLSGLCIFVGGIVYPPPSFVVCFSLGVTIFFYAVISHKSLFTRFKIQKVIPFMIFLISCIASLVILKLELTKGFPWNRWNEVELGWNDPAMKFELVYIRTLGSMIFLLPFAIGSILISRITFWKLFFIIWSLSAFLLFPFADSLSLGKFRFAEGSQIVAVSAVVTWFLLRVWVTIQKHMNLARAEFIRAIFILLIVLNFFVFTLLVSYSYTMRLWPYWTNTYFRAKEMDAFTFMNTSMPKNVVVLADVYQSNYIPAFSNVKTIVGYPDFYASQEKLAFDKASIAGILEGTYSENQVLTFLQEKDVRYVYREYPNYQNKNIYPSILKNIFRNETIEIYEVKIE